MVRSGLLLLLLYTVKPCYNELHGTAQKVRYNEVRYSEGSSKKKNSRKSGISEWFVKTRGFLYRLFVISRVLPTRKTLAENR